MTKREISNFPELRVSLPSVVSWSLVLATVLLMQLSHWLHGSPLSWQYFAVRFLFVAGVTIGASLTRPERKTGTIYCLPRLTILVSAAGIGAFLIYALGQETWWAWIAIGSLYIVLLNFNFMFDEGDSVILRWGVLGTMAVFAGLFPVALAQIESHFADEEFFVAIQACELGLFWFLLRLAHLSSHPKDSRKTPIA